MYHLPIQLKKLSDPSPALQAPFPVTAISAAVRLLFDDRSRSIYVMWDLEEWMDDQASPAAAQCPPLMVTPMVPKLAQAVGGVKLVSNRPSSISGR